VVVDVIVDVDTEVDGGWYIEKQNNPKTYLKIKTL